MRICITVLAMDVTVEGIAFMGDGGGTGIYAQYAGANLGDNLVVRHCFFDDALDEGDERETIEEALNEE